MAPNQEQRHQSNYAIITTKNIQKGSVRVEVGDKFGEASS